MTGPAGSDAAPGALRAPPKPARGDIRFGTLDLCRDADAIVELEAADTGGYEPGGYRVHRHRLLKRYAGMSDEGAAAWFGVWCDGVLAADCSLMRERTAGGGAWRFQRVATHPAFRRRGLCTALVSGVSAWGFERWKLDEAWTCAIPTDAAIGIHEPQGYVRRKRVVPRAAGAGGPMQSDRRRGGVHSAGGKPRPGPVRRAS